MNTVKVDGIINKHILVTISAALNLAAFWIINNSNKHLLYSIILKGDHWYDLYK